MSNFPYVKSVYHKYLVPLLSLMFAALLLGGIIISILIKSKISETGDEVGDDTEEQLVQETMFKQKVVAKDFSILLNNLVKDIANELHLMSYTSGFKRNHNAFVSEQCDDLVKLYDAIYEMGMLDIYGRMIYQHCNPNDSLFTKDLASAKPADLFKASDEESLFISKVFNNGKGNKYAYIAMPINIYGKPNKTLIVKIDFDFAVAYFNKHNIGEDCNLYVLNEKGDLWMQAVDDSSVYAFKELDKASKDFLEKKITDVKWEDDLIAFHKNSIGYTSVFETTNEVAYEPLKAKLDGLEDTFDSTTIRILLLAVLTILLIAILSTWMGLKVANYITEPIANLIKAITKIAEGQLNVQVPVDSDDEVGDLARSFNTMANSIKVYQEKLLQRTLLIEEQSQKLADSNAQLEQYARTVSHDLKEPLRMVNSYVQLLQRKYKDVFDEQANEYMYFAVDGTNRMTKIIKDLLVYAKFEAKAKEQPAALIDLNVIVKGVLNNLHLRIKENDAQIIVADLPTIKAKPTQMLQLFQNIISNALKYRKQAVIPMVKVTTEKQHDKWCIAIKDNGTGIPEKYLEEVFVPFKRLVAKGEIEGSGIGLATCKKIIEHHKGHIWVESVEGEGATFYFTLPLTNEIVLPTNGIVLNTQN